MDVYVDRVEKATKNAENGAEVLKDVSEKYTKVYQDVLDNIHKLKGEKGEQGIQGEKGDQGEQGIQGAIGEQGEIGPEGKQGIQGIQGKQGIQGETGPQGLQGEKGEKGATGPQGIQGNVGPEGQQGGFGPKGDQGPIGPIGVQGKVGPIGPKGSTGATGPQGIQGIKGDKGDQGNNGTSFQVHAVDIYDKRSDYDNERKNFSFYAIDYSTVSDNGKVSTFKRFTGDGVNKDFEIPWKPDGIETLILVVGGVTQGTDTYSVKNSSLNSTTISLNEAPPSGVSLSVRELIQAQGTGTLFIKASDKIGDWSAPIPFGRGPIGEKGVKGDQGSKGPQGATGATGARGPQGLQGPQGIKGVQGPSGARGEAGEKGDQGSVGVRGPQGATGEAGATGARGPQGLQGPQGIKGVQGDQGEEGVKGEKGDQGLRGPIGIQGPQGLRGPQGPQGPTGNKGATGAKGATGSQGPDGDAGRSMEAAVYVSRSPYTLQPVEGRLTQYTLFEGKLQKSESYGRYLLVDNFRAMIKRTTGALLSNTSIYADLVVTYRGKEFVQTMRWDFNGSYWINANQDEYYNLPPCIVDIPENTTGTFSVKLRVRGSGSGFYPIMVNWGAGSSRPDGQVDNLVSLFARGSSLGKV
ncbi:collagen triple helix repeat protein [Vibrio phage 1.101.O._10N.261.45.C6]|nr:collagen triple helix repeat protein [Vibrio phage 1.101.O._10N.261.45.C6]